MTTEAVPDDKALLAPKKPKNLGGHNLTILGISAALIALFSTSLSLFIYHETGDIYIDRSRPGFISKEDDTEEGPDDDIVVNDFSAEGAIDAKVIDDYLSDFDQKVRTSINKYSDAFSPDALSDDALDLIPNSAE